MRWRPGTATHCFRQFVFPLETCTYTRLANPRLRGFPPTPDRRTGIARPVPPLGPAPTEHCHAPRIRRSLALLLAIREIDAARRAVPRATVESCSRRASGCRSTMAAFIERSIADWHREQPPATPSPKVESVGDFIVSNLNRRKPRYFDGWLARFEEDADPEAYREGCGSRWTSGFAGRA